MPEAVLYSNNRCLVFVKDNIVTKRYFKQSLRAQLFRKQRYTQIKLEPLDLLFSEIQILKDLRHPNIAHILTLNDTSTSIDIQMPFYGLPLDVFNNTQYVPRHELNHILRQLFGAIEYLHSHHIIHGDIKPSNILVMQSNNLLTLIDFGSSLPIGENKYPQSTPAFQSPEYFQRDRNTDINLAAVDLWALGVTLHLILFQRFPYDTSGTIVELAESVDKYDSAAMKGVSVYGDIIVMLLQKDPDKRWVIGQIIDYLESTFVF